MFELEYPADFDIIRKPRIYSFLSITQKGFKWSHSREKNGICIKKENLMYKTGHIIRTRCGKLVFELQRAELES